RRTIELPELECHELQTRIAIGHRPSHARHLLTGGAHRLERGARWVDQMVEPAERIEHIEMRRRIEQRLMFVQAVQIDETPRELLERSGGRERAVDERAAPALRRNLPAHHQLLAIPPPARFAR